MSCSGNYQVNDTGSWEPLVILIISLIHYLWCKNLFSYLDSGEYFYFSSWKYHVFSSWKYHVMCQPRVPLKNVKLKKSDHRNLRQLKIQNFIILDYFSLFSISTCPVNSIAKEIFWAEIYRGRLFLGAKQGLTVFYFLNKLIVLCNSNMCVRRWINIYDQYQPEVDSKFQHRMNNRRESPTMSKQLVNFITCDCESLQSGHHRHLLIEN
jgi:hypothetical protein